MRHEQHSNHLYFVHKGEKVEEASQKVEHRIEDPVGHPVGKFGVVGFFAAEFGQKEQSLIGWVYQIANQVDKDEQGTTQDYEKFAVNEIGGESEHCNWHVPK